MHKEARSKFYVRTWDNYRLRNNMTFGMSLSGSPSNLFLGFHLIPLNTMAFIGLEFGQQLGQNTLVVVLPQDGRELCSPGATSKISALASLQRVQVGNEASLELRRKDMKMHRAVVRPVLDF